MGFDADHEGAADRRGGTTNTNDAGSATERGIPAGHAFEGSGARRLERVEHGTDEVPIEVAMDEHDTGTNTGGADATRGSEGGRPEKDELVDQVRQLGRRVTPEELERRGVRKLRQFTISDLNELVARTVDRVLSERGDGDGDAARNTVLERTHAALAERAANDPQFRIELLERRLNKLADALDRSENALAEVLDDVEAGLPTARRYVDSLPDNHPLRRRGTGTRRRRRLAGRTRTRRLEPTDEEARRVEERRGMLRALAEVNRLDEERREEEEAEVAKERATESEPAIDESAPIIQPDPVIQPDPATDSEPRTERRPERDPRADLRELARRPHDDDGSKDSTDGATDASTFDEVRPEDLRLRMDLARPHRGFGWRSGLRRL